MSEFLLTDPPGDAPIVESDILPVSVVWLVWFSELIKKLNQAPIFNITSATANYTLTLEDQLVLCNGNFTVTLPAAASAKYKGYKIKNIGSSVVALDGNGAETIDEVSTKYVEQYETLDVISDGTEWWSI